MEMEHIRHSLLWPAEHSPSSALPLPKATIRDLSLHNTINAFSNENQVRIDFGRIILQLTSNLEVIRYRQEIMGDFLANPVVVQTFEAVLPQMNSLASYRHYVDRKKSNLQQIAWRASELENLVECVSVIVDNLSPIRSKLESRGLQTFLDTLIQLRENERFQSLERELPALLPDLRANVSVTIGVNLDRQLRPVEATLLSVNADRFESPTILDQLLGKRPDNWTGLAPIHRAPADIYGANDKNEVVRRGAVDPLMVPLFRDLAEVLNKICRPIEKALRNYVSLNGSFLGEMRRDVDFYLAAARLVNQLAEHDLPMCQPEMLPIEDRVCQISGSYNLNLARHLIAMQPGKHIGDQIIKNDIDLSDQGRIQILTGPNQGGKTTYTQMVGLNHLLAQAGLPIPGRSAKLSPVDQIFTHYPVEEELELDTGRFGDEAKRLGEVFQSATRHSLILLNESLASTSPGEGIYLAQDIVRTMRMMGARAIFGTHMHELARSVSEINESVSGDSDVISMVASRIDESETVGNSPHKRNYQIIPGPPAGRSYANEIARQYGISFGQLTESLRQRDVIK